jgi:hypothetical protein
VKEVVLQIVREKDEFMARRFEIAVAGMLLVAMLNGCAVQGYNLGKRIDIENTNFREITYLAEIEARDGVRVLLADETILVGIVDRITADSLYLHVNESLTDTEFFSRVNGDRPFGTPRGYRIDSLQSIELLHVNYGGRVLVTALGGILDVPISIAFGLILLTIVFGLAGG